MRVSTHTSIDRAFPAGSGVCSAGQVPTGRSGCDQITVRIAVYTASLSRSALLHLTLRNTAETKPHCLHKIISNANSNPNLDSIASDEPFDGGENARVSLLHLGVFGGQSVFHLGVLPLGLGGPSGRGGAPLLRCLTHSQPHCPKSHM